MHWAGAAGGEPLQPLHNPSTTPRTHPPTLPCPALPPGRYVGDDVSPDFYGWVFPKYDHVAVGTGTVVNKTAIKQYQQATRDRAKVKTEGGQIIRVEAHPIPEHPRPRRVKNRVALVRCCRWWWWWWCEWVWGGWGGMGKRAAQRGSSALPPPAQACVLTAPRPLSFPPRLPILFRWATPPAM